MQYISEFEKILESLDPEAKQCIINYIEVMMFLAYTDGVRIGTLIGNEEDEV